MAVKKKTAEDEQPVLTCLQFCNQLGLRGYDRSIIVERFADFKGTFEEWKNKLEKIGLNIN